MSITTVPSVVTGQTYSAANYNTQVRDNINGIWVLTTAGDMLYATGASAANRLALVVGGVMYGGASAPAWLAKPSSDDSVLKNTSAGVPSWLGITSIPGIIHTSGVVESTTERNTASTSLVDVTGLTLDLTLTATCSIYAYAFGQGRTDDGVYYPSYRLNIDGTDDPTAILADNSASKFMWSTIYKRTGIAAGTRTVKMRFSIQNATDLAYCTSGRIIAIAVKE